MGFGSACSSCMVSVVLYKRDGIGSDMSDNRKGVLDTFTKVPKEAGMMGVGVAGCQIYGAVCNAACAIAASEMVWVEQNGLIL